MNDKTDIQLVPSAALQMATRGEIVAHVRLVQEVMEAVMKENVHYGVVPGTKRPSLWKPGAEVLGVTFRIAATYNIEELSDDDRIRYRVICIGKHQLTGQLLGEGVGTCNSMEEKYKWRRAAHKNEYDATPEDHRRVKYYSNGGTALQVRTAPDDLDNTILKMAAKRAQVAMAINVTAASDIFAQDLEDLPPEVVGDWADGEQTTGKPPVAEPQAKSGAAKKPEAAVEDPAADNTISPGAQSLLVKKLAAAALTDADLCKHFGLAGLDGLKNKQLNAALDWIKNPNGGA